MKWRFQNVSLLPFSDFSKGAHGKCIHTYHCWKHSNTNRHKFYIKNQHALIFCIKYNLRKLCGGRTNWSSYSAEMLVISGVKFIFTIWILELKNIKLRSKWLVTLYISVHCHGVQSFISKKKQKRLDCLLCSAKARNRSGFNWNLRSSWPVPESTILT